MLRRLLFFFRRNQFERDLEDELRFHEEMKAGGRTAAAWQSTAAAWTVARTVDLRDG
jgi:hypothetical protein